MPVVKICYSPAILPILCIVLDGELQMPVFLDANAQGFVRMSAFSWSATYIAILLVIAVLLSANVAFRRPARKIGVGDGGDAQMLRYIRVQGNFSEYAPLAIGALVMLAAISAPLWTIHVVGLAMVTGRILHAFGLSQTEGKSPGRVLGMLLTWSSLLAAALFLVWFGWR